MANWAPTSQSPTLHTRDVIGVELVMGERAPSGMLSGAHLPFSRRAEQIMPMPASARRWTADEVRALTDESRPGPRYELIDGELLVTPTPRPVHQIASLELARKLADYVEAEGLGLTLMSPADLELHAGTIVQPDVFVVPAADSTPLFDWRQVRALLLAVEIISPSIARQDRETKRAFFQRAGVPEYWVVDLDARRVERWWPGDEQPEIVREWLEWRPLASRPPFHLDLKVFFRRVVGEKS
jgi:Uma2 family endonuclease